MLLQFEHAAVVDAETLPHTIAALSNGVKHVHLAGHSTKWVSDNVMVS